MSDASVEESGKGCADLQESGQGPPRKESHAESDSDISSPEPVMNDGMDVLGPVRPARSEDCSDDRNTDGVEKRKDEELNQVRQMGEIVGSWVYTLKTESSDDGDGTDQDTEELLLKFRRVEAMTNEIEVLRTRVTKLQEQIASLKQYVNSAVDRLK
jgi:hypothetical protein